MPAPTAEERKACHDARDRYFACVDSSGGDEAACVKEKELFHKTCPASWVKYFSRKKIYDEYKKKLNTEGAKYDDQSKS